MKITRKEWMAYIMLSAMMAAAVYAVSADDMDVRILRGVTRFCQGTARVFGGIGLETEKMYLAILESGRMV